MNTAFKIKILMSTKVSSSRFWLIMLISPFVFSQQTQLKGTVSVHNSKYETGKIKYVKDAFVFAPFTKPANTDNKGNFSLEFVGIDPGTSVALQVEKQGLEVVNGRDLEDVVISRKLPLRVFVAKKGQLAQAQTELYNISKKALFAQKDALITRLRAGEAESKAAIAELEEKFNQKLTNRFEAEALLNSKIAELQKRLPEFAQELAAVNLDFASELYIEAYGYFRKGEIEKVIAILDQKKLEKSYEEARNAINEGKRLTAIGNELEEKGLLQIEQLINSYELKAESYSLLFQYGKAAQQYEKVISIYEEQVLDKKKLAGWHDKTAKLYRYDGKYAKALEYYQKALTIRKKILNPKHSDLADSYYYIGNTYWSLGKYKKTHEFLQKSLAIKEEILDAKHPDLVRTYSNIGNIYMLLGDSKKALKHYQKALTIRKKILNPKHPDLAGAYSNIGIIYRLLGKYEKALEFQQKTLTIWKETLDVKHPDFASTYINIGSIYRLLEKHKKALEYYQKALIVYEETLDSKHPHLAGAYISISSTYRSLEKYEKALEYERKALVIWEESFGPNHPYMAISYYNIGNTFYMLGDYRKALEYYQKAIPIQEKGQDSSQSDIARSYLGLAKTHLSVGNVKKSLKYQQKAIKIFKISSLSEGHTDIKEAKKLLKKIKKALKDKKQ